MLRCSYLELYFSSCICSYGFSTKTIVLIRNIRFIGNHKIKSVGLKLKIEIFHKNAQQLIQSNMNYFNHSHIQESINKQFCYFRGFLGPWLILILGSKIFSIWKMPTDIYTLWCFQGLWKKTSGMKWVNDSLREVSKYGPFSGPYFPAFGVNMERYRVSLRIHSECGKIRTRKNSVSGHFSRSDWIR